MTRRATPPDERLKVVPLPKIAVGLMLGGLDGNLDVIVPRGGKGLVGRVQAEARVLPWTECPQAVGSAGRLVGWKVDELRPEARTQLVGPSTCTHLNDVLRGLEDVHWLTDLLPSP